MGKVESDYGLLTSLRHSVFVIRLNYATNGENSRKQLSCSLNTFAKNNKAEVFEHMGGSKMNESRRITAFFLSRNQGFFMKGNS
ncbi:hypothetical protein INT80_03760 [Gallibacterium anatis]|uniref:Uncharacterized protein n=1 Tax=Gallibacterium anatis TaxID=750 RepID=A0A930UTD8_9PAST|nr:hypothetical protein [Gallibacterium anatis]